MHDRTLIRWPRLHITTQIGKRQIKQALKAGAQQGLRRVGSEAQLGASVVAHHTALHIQRQQVFGLHVQKLRRTGQAQNPVAPMAVQKSGVLNVVCIHLHQLQCQVLARFGLGRAELRNIQHRTELATAVVNGCRGAGQGDVCGIKMVVQVHRECLPGADAGAHAASARVLLAPVRPQVQPGFAKAGLKHQITQKIHRHALGIGQQHHITQPGHLGVKRLQPVTGDVQKRLHLVLVFAQTGVRQDDGFLHAGGVQLVLVHTTKPGVANQLFMARRGQGGSLGGHADHGGDVRVLGGVHGQARFVRTAAHFGWTRVTCQDHVFPVTLVLWPAQPSCPCPTTRAISRHLFE